MLVAGIVLVDRRRDGGEGAVWLGCTVFGGPALFVATVALIREISYVLSQSQISLLLIVERALICFNECADP